MSGPVDWSNAKKARIFLTLIGHLAVKYGDRGELRIKRDEIEGDVTIGFDQEDGELIIAVDMDTVDDTSAVSRDELVRLLGKAFTEIRAIRGAMSKKTRDRVWSHPDVWRDDGSEEAIRAVLKVDDNHRLPGEDGYKET